MPTDMQTVTTTANYDVAASDQLVFTNQVGFQLSQPTPGGQLTSPSPHLEIAGEVDVVETSSALSGALGEDGIVVENTFNSGTVVTVDPGALLKVTVADGSAYGYFGGGSAGPTFDNAGTVFVSAQGAATGLFNQTNSGHLVNTGLVTVTSATSDATGLKTQNYDNDVDNSGTISVTGHGQVTGVDMGASGTGETFHNSGTIVAFDDSAAQISVGVHWANDAEPGLPDSFVNDGAIEADRAIDVETTFGAASDNVITNNGHLIGQVWLGGGGAETLVNNGVIDGSIQFVGAGSVYDGRLGEAHGTILGSNNGGDTFLGGSGAETMTGGLGNDTIDGNGGNDLIDGGGGSDVLDGGSGVNTLSFASASRGVQVDLAAGTAHTATGIDVFTGFSQLLGGAYGDTISGVASGADYLRGEGGNDSIVGGAGFNDINGNTGDDTIAGHSTVGDWLVGGQGSDLISTTTSGNILYGNLGNDTLIGGTGGDILRGGQGDDSIVAGSGAEWISGDRGNDTIEAGSGPDTFHSFSGAGIDQVIGFKAGVDHVQLDPGTAYTLAQSGPDTIVDMGHGDEMILKSVTLTSLTDGWIFEG